MKRLKTKFHLYCRQTRGFAAIELALTFPFFMFFLLLIVEVSLYFFATSAVEKGVHNYSRQLVEMTRRGTTASHEDQIEKEIAQFVGPRLVKSVRFAAGQVTTQTNFEAPLRRSHLDRSYLQNRDQPLYFRVVVERPMIAQHILKPFWDQITHKNGLIADIDILIVVPYPHPDAS